MGKINISRVVLGGLIAGLVFILVEMIVEGTFALFGLSERILILQASDNITLSGARYHLVNIVFLFAFCVFAVWVYASIRPRFGPGPKTAFITALGFWFFLLLLAINFLNIGVFPVKLTFISLLFSLIELPPAIIAGASIYKEV